MRLLNSSKIGLSGGCHWCTEAVFQSLKGVSSVAQGYISSAEEVGSFSEGIIVVFSSEIITLETLIEIHLRTHQSASDHALRSRYRSGIYTFSEEQKEEAILLSKKFQLSFNKTLVTKIYDFGIFKHSRQSLKNYYYSNPNRPFCERYIDPKLNMLREKFGLHLRTERSLPLTTI